MKVHRNTIATTIHTSPRIHLGLISMHVDGVRRYGGLGFTVDGPELRISIQDAEKLTIADNREFPLTPPELFAIQESLSRYLVSVPTTQSFSFTISGEVRSHVGMGSGTLIRLSMLELISKRLNLNHPPEVLIKNSGRGGTSGVGITTYFSGGLVLDLGKPNSVESFLPSSMSSGGAVSKSLPPLIMPSWQLLLCIPRQIVPKTQQEELAFFSENAPTSAESSFEVSYHAVFGVYASVLEADYRSFCTSIDRLQDTGFKAREHAIYGKPLTQAKEFLRKMKVDCVGMSSLGPMLFCFGSPESLNSVEMRCSEFDCLVFRVTPKNSGRTIKTL